MSGAEATVRKLREDIGDQKAAPALGFSLQFDLGGNRTLVLQTHVDADAPPTVLNSMLDHISSAADRMRTKYDLKVMRKELAHQRKTLKSLDEDLERIDARAKGNYDAKLKDLARQIVEGD